MRRRMTGVLLVIACSAGAVGVAHAADSTTTTTTTSSSSSTAPSRSSGSGSSGATTWTQVTDGTDVRNVDEVGLVRTADDVLHVFWRHRLGASQEEIRHTPVTGGSVGTSTTASGPFATVGNPVGVVTSDGRLRIFFAALTGSESALDGVLSASSDAQAKTWTTDPSRVSSTTSAIPEGVGAAVAPDGTPAFVYAYSFVLGYHPGLDPAVADVDLIPGNACCAYLPNLAFTSATGTVAWFSNVEGASGYQVQTVSPAVGTATTAPNPFPDGKWVTPSQRSALVTREGTDEVFLGYCTGYPSCEQVDVWKVGSTTPPIVPGKSSDIEKVNLSSDPDGRLWVLWQDAYNGTLHAARSNDDGTEFGAAVAFEATDDTETVWKLAGSATADHLDVVASLGTSDGINAYTTKILPGLTVDATSSKGSTKFVVTDAGEPVKGAKVTFRTKTVTTNAKGTAVGPAGKGVSTVTRSGYTPATFAVDPNG